MTNRSVRVRRPEGHNDLDRRGDVPLAFPAKGGPDAPGRSYFLFSLDRGLGARGAAVERSGRGSALVGRC